MAEIKKSKAVNRVGSLIGVFFSLICLGVFIYQIDVKTVVEALSQFEIQYLPIAFLGLALGYSIRIYRWCYILKAVEPNVQTRACVAPFLAAIALNNVLPFRMGDIIRAFVFPRSMNISRLNGVGSLLIERILDLLTILFCFFFSLQVIDKIQLPEEFILFCQVAMIGVLLAFVFLFLLQKLDLSAYLQKKTRLSELGSNFVQALALMSDLRLLLMTIVFSLILWCAEAAFYFMILLGFGIEVNSVAALLSMSVATLSTLIPSAPGFIGAFHIATFAVLSALGYDEGFSGSAAILIHLALWGGTTSAGGLMLFLKPELFQMAKTGR
ncbi:lysylphosphatidylglycerol synthase transmembrane domain-containing protein [Terasakiella sp.]|uniref:lysylphosphatidylglycerol synthase transmembrane domain-containing protein n=1 Tax=Terasakiella sp. TaxID=2034861 RepID=UPI003AA93C46